MDTHPKDTSYTALSWLFYALPAYFAFLLIADNYQLELGNFTVVLELITLPALILQLFSLGYGIFLFMKKEVRQWFFVVGLILISISVIWSTLSLF